MSHFRIAIEILLSWWMNTYTLLIPEENYDCHYELQSSPHIANSHKFLNVVVLTVATTILRHLKATKQFSFFFGMDLWVFCETKFSYSKTVFVELIWHCQKTMQLGMAQCYFTHYCCHLQSSQSGNSIHPPADWSEPLRWGRPLMFRGSAKMVSTVHINAYYGIFDVWIFKIGINLFRGCLIYWWISAICRQLWSLTPTNAGVRCVSHIG